MRHRVLTALLVAGTVAVTAACNDAPAPISTPTPGQHLEANIEATQTSSAPASMHNAGPDYDLSVKATKDEIYAILEDIRRIQSQGIMLASAKGRPYLSPTLLDETLADRIRELDDLNDLSDIIKILSRMRGVEDSASIILSDIHGILDETGKMLSQNVPACPPNKFATNHPVSPPEYGVLRTGKGAAPIAFYLGWAQLIADAHESSVGAYKVEAEGDYGDARACLAEHKSSTSKGTSKTPNGLHQLDSSHMYGKNGVLKPRYAPKMLSK